MHYQLITRRRKFLFKPSQLFSSFTGVPVVVDLAGMHDTLLLAQGGQADQINPGWFSRDHSVQVDFYGCDTIRQYS